MQDISYLDASKLLEVRRTFVESNSKVYTPRDYDHNVIIKEDLDAFVKATVALHETGTRFDGRKVARIIRIESRSFTRVERYSSQKMI